VSSRFSEIAEPSGTCTQHPKNIAHKNVAKAGNVVDSSLQTFQGTKGAVLGVFLADCMRCNLNAFYARAYR
jgi:hypothetical protein